MSRGGLAVQAEKRFGSSRRRSSSISRITASTIFALLLGVAATCHTTDAQSASNDQNPPSDLKQLSLEELGNVEVTTVSKEPQQVQKTPAAIFVITQEDIRRSGATSIPEALRLAPGVEVAHIDRKSLVSRDSRIRGPILQVAAGADRRPKHLYAALLGSVLGRRRT